MRFHTRLVRTRNGLAIRIPQKAVDALGLSPGAVVEIKTQDGNFVVSCVGAWESRLTALVAGDGDPGLR